MAKSFKEKEDSSKGRDMCFSRAGGLWLEVCIAFVHSNEEVLVARTGLNRKATSEVTGSLVRTRDGAGDSLRGKRAMHVIVRERGGIKKGLGASGGSKNSTSRERGVPLHARKCWRPAYCDGVSSGAAHPCCVH